MSSPQVMGIYAIVHDATGSFYLGSSVRLADRFRNHRNQLRRGIHRNPHLQRAWDKYGADAFRFEVIALLDASDLEATENRLLAKIVGRADCYNVALYAGTSMRGRKHTPESRARIAAANSGRKWGPHTPEHRTAISEGMLRSGRVYPRGHKHSEEHKRKIALGGMGKPCPGKARLAIIERNKAFVWTPERRARVGNANRVHAANRAAARAHA